MEQTTPSTARTDLAGVRIALVFPTFLEADLASYQDNGKMLGVVPPLSLIYVASVLQQAGARVMVLDCIALGIGLEEAVLRLQTFQPEYVGFTLTTVDWASSLRWMQGVHAAIDAHIIVGGIQLECYPAETLSHDCISLGFVGHADQGAVELLAAHAGDGDLSAVPGAVFRDGEGQVVQVPPHRRPQNDAEMPWPARELLPLHAYHTIVSTERPFTAAMSSFGCPYGCEFCILRLDALRMRSATSVVDEMEFLVRELGIREIDFFDPIFTIRRNRALEICAQLHARGLADQVIWSIRCRTDAVDRDVLRAMYKAGCRRVYYGIESGDPAIRRRVNKRMSTNADITSVIEDTKAMGYEVLAFVMVGNPGETEQSVAATRRLLLDSPIDLVQVASLFPLPNTPIYKALVAQTGVDIWREHTLHGTPVHPVARYDTALDDDQVNSLVSGTYARFYFRPKFLRFALGRCSQPDYLRRGLVAAATIGRNALSGARRPQKGSAGS